MASSAVFLTVLVLISTVDFTGAEVSLPTTTATATDGNTIRPWCSVTGETFDGWFNPKGEKITTDKSQRKHVETIGDKHFLAIKHVNPATDGGIYQCRGNLNSASWTLNIGFVATPDEKQKLTLDEPGTIYLEAHGYPNPTYAWKKNGNPLNPANDPRISLQEDGSLKISKVEVSDEAKYVCDVNQQQLFTSKTVTITVSVIQKPVITLKPKVTRVLTEGFNTTFKCNATGRPQPTIRWIDENGREIDSSVDARYSVSDGHLTITGVLKKDVDKTYSCEAKNKEDDDVVTAVITKVWVRPKLKALSDETKNEEDKVTLVCEAEAGDDPMTVVWKKDGVKFQKQDQKSRRSTIAFEKVLVENSGKYICEATNGAIDDNGKTIVEKEELNLFVKSPPRLNKQKSTSPVYSFVGNPKPVKIVCEFFGYPLPNITMTKNGTEIMTGQKTVTYEITDTKENSFGTFHCLATNKNGNESHTVELKKADAPEKVKNLKSVPSCNSIKVMWQKPNFDGGLQITFYDVKIKDENGTEVAARSVNAPTTSHTVTRGIKKEKQYEISVSARSTFPQRGSVETATVTTTKYCAPSKPFIKNDVSEPLDELKLTLVWTKPDNDGGDPVIKYRVAYQSYKNGILQENKTIGETTESEMVINEHLVAGRTYTFRIIAINKGGESQASVLQFKVSPSAGPTTTAPPPSTTQPASVSLVASTSSASSEPQAPITEPSASARPTGSKNGTRGEPEVGARKKDGLSSGVIAAIVIVVILIVLIAIDLFCCYFNGCGLFFCCHKNLCGGGGAKKKDGKIVKSKEMEKLNPAPEQV